MERKLVEILEPQKWYKYGEVINLISRNRNTAKKLLHYFIFDGQIEVNQQNNTYRLNQ